MNSRTRGVAEMVAAMVVSGTIGWFVVRSRQPLADLLFWRCVFGGATLLAVCAWLGLLRGHLAWRQAAVAALGGAALVANWWLIFGAFAHTSISVATALYNTQPFLLVALGALFLGERLTAARLLWLVSAFAGVLLIVQAKDGGGVSSGSGGGHYAIGVLMSLGAAFCYAVAALLTKRLAGTPPHLIALVQMGVGAVLLAPFANRVQLPVGLGVWSELLVMGVVYTGLVYILLYGAIQKLPTALAGALSFIYPVVAIAVDYVAFGHRLQPAQIAGAAVILVSAAAMTLGWVPWRARPVPGT